MVAALSWPRDAADRSDACRLALRDEPRVSTARAGDSRRAIAADDARADPCRPRGGPQRAERRLCGLPSAASPRVAVVATPHRAHGSRLPARARARARGLLSDLPRARGRPRARTFAHRGNHGGGVCHVPCAARRRASARGDADRRGGSERTHARSPRCIRRRRCLCRLSRVRVPTQSGCRHASHDHRARGVRLCRCPVRRVPHAVGR